MLRLLTRGPLTHKLVPQDGSKQRFGLPASDEWSYSIRVSILHTPGTTLTHADASVTISLRAPSPSAPPPNAPNTAQHRRSVSCITGAPERPVGLLVAQPSSSFAHPLHSRPSRRAFPLLALRGLRADVPLLEHAAVATHVLSLQSSRWDNRGAESLQMSLKRRVVFLFQLAVTQIRLFVLSRGRAVYWQFSRHVQEVRVAIRIVDSCERCEYLVLLKVRA